MSQNHTIHLTRAVAKAIEHDLSAGYTVKWGKDVSVTGTLDQLALLADLLLLRHPANKNQNTINTCNKAGYKLAAFVREKRAEEGTWQCLTCTREGTGQAPTSCPFCLSEADDDHGPHAPEPEAPECAVCDGPLSVLGGLGNTTHYRCRDCGIGSYRSAT